MIALAALSPAKSGQRKIKANDIINLTISSTKITYCSNCNRWSPPVECTSKSNCRSIIERSSKKFPDVESELGTSWRSPKILINEIRYKKGLKITHHSSSFISFLVSRVKTITREKLLAKGNIPDNCNIDIYNGLSFIFILTYSLHICSLTSQWLHLSIFQNL